MKTERRDRWVCALFCAFLFGICALYLALPKQSWSALEKRYLAEEPELTAQTLFSGRFSEEMESYMADHLPGRGALVGLSAYYDLLSGRQSSKEIVLGRSGRLYERPVAEDPQALRSRMETIDAFAETLGRDVDLLLIPSSGYLLREDMLPLTDSYRDDELIARCYALASPAVRTGDLLGLFEAAEDPGALFYATDHHWTSLGAYRAAAFYLEGKGRTLPPESAYRVTAAEGFAGSAYSRSALWLHEAETIEVWDSGTAFSLTNSESPESHAGLFYPERLEEEDKYTVFLDGNHAWTRIENRSPDAEGSLLLIGDSFSNCLSGFLAEGYRTVLLVDLRYYKHPVSELYAAEGFDDVLILYSLRNFMTDANLLWLE